MKHTLAACVVGAGEEAAGAAAADDELPAAADELPAADDEPDDEPVVDACDEDPDDDEPDDVDDVPFTVLAACFRPSRLKSRLYVVGT